VYSLLKVADKTCRNEQCLEGMRDHLFWGVLNRIMFESYSIATVSCLINLKFLSFTKLNVGFMSATAIVALIVLIAFPALYSKFLADKWSNVRDKNNKSFKRKHS